MAVLATLFGCVGEGGVAGDAGEDGESMVGEPKWHEHHTGAPPWPHILTCYGGCSEPHYDPSACGGGTACCSRCIDGSWWYSTEQRNFGCGAKLELRRGDRCVIVEVADNGPADWVEDNAASRCGGEGHIIDTSPLVNDYFGGGCGWSECFMVDVRPVAEDLPQGICPSCPCDGPPPFPLITMAAECDTIDGFERDLCLEHDSSGIFDMSVGQSTVCRVSVTNEGSGIGANVRVGITIEEPYLRAIHYDIYDNWSGNPCGGDWCLNDSNSNPENAPHDGPGASFVLNINALSPGETKRVEMTVVAEQCSIDVADHPDVRGWVRHIDDWYEKADFWSADFNNVGGHQTFNGGDLRIWTETDVLDDEICANEIDEDCDGVLDNGCGPDGDADSDADGDGDLDSGPETDGDIEDDLPAEDGGHDSGDPEDGPSDGLGFTPLEGGCACRAVSPVADGRLHHGLVALGSL
jgi:hypothetical protein